MLTPETLPAVQAALAEAKVDGWLLYDFRGINPISRAMFRAEGLASRRMVAWVPREGHAGRDHARDRAGSWRTGPRVGAPRVLVVEIAGGGNRVARARQDGGDGILARRRRARRRSGSGGVIEMVRAAGATVVTSGESRDAVFRGLDRRETRVARAGGGDHRAIAKEAFARAGASVKSGTPLTEHGRGLDPARIRGERALHRHGPNVAATEMPRIRTTVRRPTRRAQSARGDSILIDLWAWSRARRSPTRRGWRRWARRRRSCAGLGRCARRTRRGDRAAAGPR